VRTKNDFAAGNIPNAHQLHGGRVLWHLDELLTDAAIVTHCQSGPRSAVVASLLRASGYEGVAELEGSYAGWKKVRERRKASV
jgi:hydroxyacylglutathione hydrolase